MASYCLPKKFTAAFIQRLQSGTINLADLINKSSAERRTFFESFLGEDHAKEVNSLFESKLLLKNQQKGFIDWAKQVAGLTPDQRQDIIDRIMAQDKLLQPASQKAFLADLANQKLGITVNAKEAQDLFDAAKLANDKKTTMLKDITNIPNRIAYGRAVMDLNDKVESMKPGGRTFGQLAVDVVNIPKSMLTSIFHFSAPFVQNWGMMSIGRSWEAFGQMFRYFASEENYKNLNAYIISHPDYHLAVDGKLGLTALGDKLSTREEAIQSTLVEQANKALSDKTGIPNLVRASSRAFTGFLNYVRFNRFTDLLNAARLSGEDVRAGSSVVRDLAKVVNDFTGRGALGKGDQYANIGPALNVGIFSPRKISATMEMFDPKNYLDPRISPTARKAAIRQLSGSLIATGAALSLARACGAQVNFDPRSQDFLKIQIGQEKLDITGGNAIYLRLWARILTGQEITSRGKLIELGQGYKPTTRMDLVENFVRDKLAPLASFMVDAMYGTDPVGRPFRLTDEAREKLMPITLNSFLNYYYNDPNNAVAVVPALSAIFGVSLQSPLPPITKSGLDVWGDPVGMFNDASKSNIDEAFDNAGLTAQPPGDSINGVKLNDAQYHNYMLMSGKLAKAMITPLINSPNWDQIPQGVRASTLQGIMKQARTATQPAIMMQSHGTNNDILNQSVRNKLGQTQ